MTARGEPRRMAARAKNGDPQRPLWEIPTLGLSRGRVNLL